MVSNETIPVQASPYIPMLTFLQISGDRNLTLPCNRSHFLYTTLITALQDLLLPTNVCSISGELQTFFHT